MSYSNTLKNYHRRRARQGMGAGPSDCGAGQTFYPNLTYAGVTGQCSDPASAQAALNNGTATGNLSSAAPSTGSGDTSVGSNIGAALKSLFGGGSPSGQIPTLPYLPSSGPDMTTVVLIGGVAALGIYLVTRK